MSRWILCCVGLIWGSVLTGQEKYSISGFVRDAKTGEELIGAAVSIMEIPAAGAYTNSYGFYSLTVPKGNYNITITLMGYEFLSVSLELTKDTRQNFDLIQKINQLNEVTITSKKGTTMLQRTRPELKSLISRRSTISLHFLAKGMSSRRSSFCLVSNRPGKVTAALM